jgi:hypothetical protein
MELDFDDMDAGIKNYYYITCYVMPTGHKLPLLHLIIRGFKRQDQHYEFFHCIHEIHVQQ